MTGNPNDTPRTLDELLKALQDAVDFTHNGGGDGYQRSADAMWRAALAAFNWAASEVGATGFQASWAALQFYAKAMGVKGPFTVVKVEDALYPQYDLPGRLDNFLSEQRGWLAEEAKSRLDAYEADPVSTYTDDDGIEHEVPSAHPRVVEHWRSLVAAVSS